MVLARRVKAGGVAFGEGCVCRAEVGAAGFPSVQKLPHDAKVGLSPEVDSIGLWKRASLISSGETGYT